jgi:hypothetical protein
MMSRRKKKMKPHHQTSQIITPIIFLMGILFSAYALIAASIVKLGGLMPALGSVSNFRISPDGRYAVYQADQNTDGIIELYSVILGGGARFVSIPFCPPEGRSTGSRSVRIVPGYSIGLIRTTRVSMTCIMSPSGGRQRT